MTASTGLRNHIPLSGPATREPCDGRESPMRVSLGFTPTWYADRLGTDFSEAWHLDPEYRYSQMLRMKEYLAGVFPEVEYFRPRFGKSPVTGKPFEPGCATLSTVFGIMPVSSLYGLPIAYRGDNWPDAAGGMHLPKEEFALPLDRALSRGYARFGVHTCNWVIDSYADSLRKIEKMDYIDTGMHSDLARVKRLFPEARRAVLYTPGEAESKSSAEIRADLERVTREYAPCDMVLADVETTASDARIREFLEVARELGGLVREGKPQP